MDRDARDYQVRMKQARYDYIKKLVFSICVVVAIAIICLTGGFLIYEKIHDNEPRSPKVMAGTTISCVVE